MPLTLEPTSTQASTRRPADGEIALEMLNLLRRGADVRQHKVRKVRAAVRVKAYENPLKLSVAIDRLIAVLES